MSQFEGRDRSSSTARSGGGHAAATPGKRSLTDALIQRKEAGAGAVGDGAEAAVAAAGSSTGAPLPGELRGKFEQSLGADLGGVRVHTGGESAQAAAAVDAKAFTVGNDIHFGLGDYVPSSQAGQTLIAHEVAHTVQQAGRGPTTQFKLNVSSANDAAEIEADRAADSMVRGEPVGRLGSAPTSLARKAKSTVVDGGDEMTVTDVPNIVQEDKAESVDGGGGLTIAPGKAGYARAMLAATGARAEKMAHNYTDEVLTNLVPDLSPYTEFGKVRAKEKQDFYEEAEPAKVPLLGWSLGGAPSARARWRSAGDWCQSRMDEAAKDQASEEEQFASYNAWVPRANGFFTSLERLQAQSFMLGHKNDTASLGAAILQGLDEAENVAHMAQAAHDAGNPNANLPALPNDGSLLQASTTTTQAAREMNTAYLGFQQLMMTQQADTINAEGDKDRGRLEEINQVKEFLKDVGKTVDVTVSVIEGAPAAVANATEIVQRGGATINGIRNNRQIAKGERPTHNPTYVTVDDKGNMVVRNMQTHTQTDMGSGEKSNMDGVSVGLPHDVSGLLGSIADFAYAGEVLEINKRLEQIKSRVSSVNVAKAFVREKEVTQHFQDKLNAFAIACRNLQARMAERRQQYLEYGVALDNFARKDKGAKKASSGAAGGDHFATIMTMTSAIRETIGVGRGARGGFMSPKQIEYWAQGINGRRSDTSCPMRLPSGVFNYVKSFECGENEWAQIDSMWKQVKGFNEYVDIIEKDLGPVEDRAKTMLGASTVGADGQMHGLSQGGGSGEY